MGDEMPDVTVFFFLSRPKGMMSKKKETKLLSRVNQILAIKLGHWVYLLPV